VSDVRHFFQQALYTGFLCRIRQLRFTGDYGRRRRSKHSGCLTLQCGRPLDIKWRRWPTDFQANCHPLSVYVDWLHYAHRTTEACSSSDVAAHEKNIWVYGHSSYVVNIPINLSTDAFCLTAVMVNMWDFFKPSRKNVLTTVFEQFVFVLWYTRWPIKCTTVLILITLANINEFNNFFIFYHTVKIQTKTTNQAVINHGYSSHRTSYAFFVSSKESVPDRQTNGQMNGRTRPVMRPIRTIA